MREGSTQQRTSTTSGSAWPWPLAVGRNQLVVRRNTLIEDDRRAGRRLSGLGVATRHARAVARATCVPGGTRQRGRSRRLVNRALATPRAAANMRSERVRSAVVGCGVDLPQTALRCTARGVVAALDRPGRTQRPGSGPRRPHRARRRCIPRSGPEGHRPAQRARIVLAGIGDTPRLRRTIAGAAAFGWPQRREVSAAARYHSPGHSPGQGQRPRRNLHCQPLKDQQGLVLPGHQAWWIGSSGRFRKFRTFRDTARASEALFTASCDRIDVILMQFPRFRDKIERGMDCASPAAQRPVGSAHPAYRRARVPRQRQRA